MKLIVAFALFTCFASISRASDFETAALKCFALENRCKTGMPCKDEANPKQVQCFEAMGFSKSECTFGRNHVGCGARFTEKFISQTKGCQLSVLGYVEQKQVAPAISQAQNSASECRFGNYRITEGNHASVLESKKTQSGWAPELPKMSVGFENVLSPNDVSLHAVSLIPKPGSLATPPWIYLIEGNDESPSYVCDGMPNNLNLATMSATPEVSKNRMKIFGYDDVIEPAGKKHFGGNGGRYTSVVASFSNLKEFKLCGRSIPTGTKMWYGRFNGYACTATTPGAVPLLLPVSLFPDAKGVPKDLGENELVYCEPKALKASNFPTLVKESNGGKKPIVIPKLDWQDCECQYADPEEKGRR